MHLRRSLIASVASVALLVSSASSWSFVTVGLSITLAPPALPVYMQPPIPGPRYMWVPGYWAWGDGEYYWVPGTWVLPPQAGFLWTPGYWGWVNGLYVWNPGYWGRHVGFYGGINYGFGYLGVGYVGGYWNNGEFFYNRAVNNIGVDVHINNVYTRTVVNNVTVNRVSYNGGAGGIQARATERELAAAHERHIAFAIDQQRHEEQALRNPQLRASLNHGHPAIAATSRPGEFAGRGVVGAAASPASRNAPERSEQLRPRAMVEHGGGPPHPHTEGDRHEGGGSPNEHHPDQRRQ